MDLYKSNLEFWAPLITITINSVCNSKISSSQYTAVVAPGFKKDSKQESCCYRPIPQLGSVIKVVDKVILQMIQNWVKGTDVLSEAQYSFRTSLGTIEQCLNLHLIISKYSVAKRGQLFLSLMDVSSSFDQVNQSNVWATLLGIGLDKTN